MKSRLKRELYNLLIEDEINIESGIVNRFLFAMIGIDKSNLKGSGSYGLSLKDSWNKTEKVEFNFPSVSLDQLEVLIKFLDIPRDQFRLNQSIELSENSIFQIFLPKFKEYYQQQKQENSPLIRKYKIKSKPLLEASAVSTLKEYTKKALATILDNSENSVKESPAMKKVVDSIMLLQAKISTLSQRPSFFETIIDTKRDFSDLPNIPEIAKNISLKKQLTLVCEGIDLFAKYHRNQSVIANLEFGKEIEIFLNKNFSISDKCCDVVEETLVRLAGAELGPNARCKFGVGSDQSRRVFYLIDIDKVNTEKVVNYLRAIGDETAIAGSGSSQYSSSIPERIEIDMQEKCVERQSYCPEEDEPVRIERHEIEMDGLAAKEKLLPQLMDELNKMREVAPEKLQAYRLKSLVHMKKVYKEEETTSLSSNLHSMFGTASGISNAQHTNPNDANTMDTVKTLTLS